MIPEAEIRLKGMQALEQKLGPVDADRFITLIMREPFDYTEWQRNLWKDKSVKEISSKAMKLRKKMAGKCEIRRLAGAR